MEILVWTIIMGPWSPPNYDVKIIGGRKVVEKHWQYSIISITLLKGDHLGRTKGEEETSVCASHNQVLNAIYKLCLFFVGDFSQVWKHMTKGNRLPRLAAIALPVNVSNSSSSKFAHFRRPDMIGRLEIATSLLSPVPHLRSPLAVAPQTKRWPSLWKGQVGETRL